MRRTVASKVGNMYSASPGYRRRLQSFRKHHMTAIFNQPHFQDAGKAREYLEAQV